jgi:hypothetical protein
MVALPRHAVWALSRIASVPLCDPIVTSEDLGGALRRTYSRRTSRAWGGSSSRSGSPSSDWRGTRYPSQLEPHWLGR